MKRQFPLAAADQCVKCGMCLPYCPTYGATKDESESPRGRIMLMQGLATGRLTVSPALESHLDGCLTCRACESVCPADVPYGTLIDAVRERLASERPARTRLARIMGGVLTHGGLRFAVALALWIYQRSGLQFLVRKLRLLGGGRLARLESLLPAIHLPRLPRGSAAGRVALFAGCTSPLVEPETLQAALQLLTALGCETAVPPGQGCCGAMHQHAGLREPAQACARRNVDAFTAADAIVGVASGCTTQLVEYEALLGEPGRAFSQRVTDVHRFIAEHPNAKNLRFDQLQARVLLHTPCTLRNVLDGGEAVVALLRRIPGLQVERFDRDCCGAAGSYFISQPEMADRLLEPKIAATRGAAPAWVLTSNVGCSMHLAAGLRRAGLTVPVWHPLRLLARQLVDPPRRA